MKFDPGDGSAFVASPKGFHAGCVCCGLTNVAIDKVMRLCRDCWRAWRFRPSTVAEFDK